MQSAWRAIAVASLSMTMLLSGSASLAAGPEGTALPDLWPRLTAPSALLRVTLSSIALTP